MQQKNIITYFLLILTVGVLTFTGCEEVVDPNFVSPEDSAAAASMVDSANHALEVLMQTMFNAEPDSVQDMLNLLDYSEPYALYLAAHDLDPLNSDANFGLAFTGFLMLSQNAQLEEMLLRWESYFNIHEPFVPAEPTPGLLGSGFGLPLDIAGLRTNFAPMIAAPMALSKMSMDDVPQFSEFQDLVESVFMPVIDESIAALDVVDDNEDFVFMISPVMQGQYEGDPLELDMTEIYALEMGLYSLKGILNTVVAYNFDFVSYDSVGIMTELSQGSNFATLKSNGAAALNNALGSAINATSKALAALDFLTSETDDQSNDLIQLPENIDIEEIRNRILEAQATLEGPTMIHYDRRTNMYDDQGNWMDDELISDSVYVDISQFFLTPINDFKDMLPPYTMGVAVRYDYNFISISEMVHVEEAEVTISGLDNAYLSISLNYSYNDSVPTIGAIVNLGYFAYDLTTADPASLPASVWDLYAEFESLIEQYSDQLYKYPYLSFYWTGNVTTGSGLVIDGYFNIEYEEQSTAHVEPNPAWNALTYTDWLGEWPDATMHGIFPDFDGAGIADFLGINEENWQNFNY